MWLDHYNHSQMRLSASSFVRPLSQSRILGSNMQQPICFVMVERPGDPVDTYKVYDVFDTVMLNSIELRDQVPPEGGQKWR